MALWDGRFEGSPAQEMQEFGASMDTDLQMWREDIAGSRAHATMLCSVGLLTEAERDENSERFDPCGARSCQWLGSFH